jgi:hypothetical protein
MHGATTQVTINVHMTLPSLELKANFIIFWWKNVRIERM